MYISLSLFNYVSLSLSIPLSLSLSIYIYIYIHKKVKDPLNKDNTEQQHATDQQYHYTETNIQLKQYYNNNNRNIKHTKQVKDPLHTHVLRLRAPRSKTRPARGA